MKKTSLKVEGNTLESVPYAERYTKRLIWQLTIGLYFERNCNKTGHVANINVNVLPSMKSVLIRKSKKQSLLRSNANNNFAKSVYLDLRVVLLR